MAFQEPAQMEIWITLGLGNTLISPFYREYIRRLGLTGRENVLDFGSGSGVVSRHLAGILERGGGTLTCVDLSRVWIQVARRTLRSYPNVRLCQGSIHSVGLPPDSFDIVFLHFVLHEIPSLEQPEVIRQLARLLRPAGRLLIREPSAETHGMTQAEIGCLMTAAGLQTVKLQATRSRLAGPMVEGEFCKAGPSDRRQPGK